MFRNVSILYSHQLKECLSLSLKAGMCFSWRFQRQFLRPTSRCSCCRLQGHCDFWSLASSLWKLFRRSMSFGCFFSKYHISVYRGSIFPLFLKDINCTLYQWFCCSFHYLFPLLGFSCSLLQCPLLSWRLGVNKIWRAQALMRYFGIK